MIILGAGGLATQLIEDFVELKRLDIVFWSEIPTKYSFIGELFPLIGNDEAVRSHFEMISKEFVVGISSPYSEARRNLVQRFKDIGGILSSYISPFSRVSPYGTKFGIGTVVLNQVNIEPGVTLGEECLVNKTGNIGHGCTVGAFSEIGPGAILTGEVKIGTGCFIATGAIIHPKIKIGNNVIVSAGAVVTKDIPDDAVVAGVPAQIKFFKKEKHVS